jgi:Lipocalin-like domain
MKKTTFIVLSAVILFSCKKDKETCIINASSISGSYRITAATYKANATATETDYFNILFPDACERDDVYTFNAAGTYHLADVGIVCSPSGDDNGTWSLSGTTSMVIDGDAVELESFDCKKLIIVNTDTQTAGDRLKLTLTRQ